MNVSNSMAEAAALLWAHCRGHCEYREQHLRRGTCGCSPWRCIQFPKNHILWQDISKNLHNPKNNGPEIYGWWRYLPVSRSLKWPLAELENLYGSQVATPIGIAVAFPLLGWAAGTSGTTLTANLLVPSTPKAQITVLNGITTPIAQVIYHEINPFTTVKSHKCRESGYGMIVYTYYILLFWYIGSFLHFLSTSKLVIMLSQHILFVKLSRHG